MGDGEGDWSCVEGVVSDVEMSVRVVEDEVSVEEEAKEDRSVEDEDLCLSGLDRDRSVLATCDDVAAPERRSGAVVGNG